MLSISSVMFSHNGGNGPESDDAIFRPVHQVAAPVRH